MEIKTRDAVPAALPNKTRGAVLAALPLRNAERLYLSGYPLILFPGEAAPRPAASRRSLSAKRKKPLAERHSLSALRAAEPQNLQSLTRVFLALYALILSLSVASAQVKEGAASKLRSLPAISSRAEFDTLARINADVGYALPHVMFVIDRKDKNKIYYVNSQRYRFHKDFVNGTYLSLERGREFFEHNYLQPNRRFILGTLAYQTPVRRWTFEFWEGDTINAEQIALAGNIINASFFEPVAFKPNSLKQEETSAKIDKLARVLQSEIAKEQEYQPLNLARGLGRIHIIDKLDDHVEIGSNEILVLNEVPVHLPPVAGIITSRPSTPLSHINLLAKSWGVPNAYVKNAAELLKEYDGWWVTFETKLGHYEIKRAGNNVLDEYQRRLDARRDVMTPRSNLAEKRLLALRWQRARMADAYGAKSANLGEVARASARHSRAEWFYDPDLLLRSIHQRKRSRRVDLRDDGRSEVRSRSGVPARAARRDARAHSAR